MIRHCNPYKLYLVTDEACLRGNSLLMAVEAALRGGVSFLQYRNKEKDQEKRFIEALALKTLAERYNVPFVINDDVKLALKSNADGVHLGQNDMSVAEARHILGKDKIIGVTAKTIVQVRKAENDGADYIGSGAVFGTSTKQDALPMSLIDFKSICKSTILPVVAIGGIQISNASLLEGSGAAGIAVVSGILAQNDPEDAARRLRKISEKLKSDKE